MVSQVMRHHTILERIIHFLFFQGFILAMVANEIASQPASATLTYGPVRAEVLSALFSTVTILVLSMLLVYSAIVRLIGETNEQTPLFVSVCVCCFGGLDSHMAVCDT